MANDNFYIRTNSLLKVHFPSPLTQNHWVIEEKQVKAIYAVPLEGVLMTILGVQPTTKSNIFERILQKVPTTSEQLDTILAYLLDKSIVFHVTDASELDPYFTIAQSWERAGWNTAAHYHFFTQEAPYLDYTERNKILDQVREKMKTYHTQEPDVERCKKYITNLNSQPLPNMRNILNIYGATGKA
jgi:hypothetical protein